VTAPAPKRNFWNVPEAATGAWAEKRRFAAALREAIVACVSTTAPEEALRAATAAVRDAVDRLAAFPRSVFRDAHKQAREAADLHEFADRGVLVGQCNPIAPPLRFRFEDGRSIGEVTFPAPYEGAPGWVHGGIVAAAFDQLFGHLQVNLGVSSFTANLTVNYRRPTPLATPLRLEGWLERREGRKSFILGRCLAGDLLTAEGEAIFVEVEPERIREMFHSQPPAQEP
jgi:acyl-coenzyme A thioesterase PaaI-like protein